jgi:hypothetical protein
MDRSPDEEFVSYRPTAAMMGAFRWLPTVPPSLGASLKSNPFPSAVLIQ